MRCLPVFPSEPQEASFDRCASTGLGGSSSGWAQSRGFYGHWPGPSLALLWGISTCTLISTVLYARRPEQKSGKTHNQAYGRLHTLHPGSDSKELCFELVVGVGQLPSEPGDKSAGGLTRFFCSCQGFVQTCCQAIVAIRRMRSTKHALSTEDGDGCLQHGVPPAFGVIEERSTCSALADHIFTFAPDRRGQGTGGSAQTFAEKRLRKSKLPTGFHCSETHRAPYSKTARTVLVQRDQEAADSRSVALAPCPASSRQPPQHGCEVRLFVTIRSPLCGTASFVHTSHRCYDSHSTSNCVTAWQG